MLALAPRAGDAGYRLRAFDSVGSTNGEATALARAGDPGPLWVAAVHQSAGRGRRGAAWATPPGNLAATLVRTTDLPAATCATLGFVAGLALVGALRAVAPEVEPALKWPNDVLVGGGKLAGILLESETVGDGRIVAVGIGVNVVAAPQGLPYPATSLRALGSAAAAEDLFAALSDAWLDVEAIWDEGRGMDAIRRLWLARAAALGHPVAVRVNASLARGVFETIDKAGRLILRRDDGTLAAISAGEVHFGAAATAGSDA
jgi:BirA family transcriptional regulator, biotin operon repressor / biotin---[acetyl-CoA-carboxylase] ligase